MKLSSPTGKPITLPPIHPNAGLSAAYQKRLKKLVETMHKSVVYHLAAAYKSRESEFVHDDSPALFLLGTMKRLASRWLKHFDKVAESLGRGFAEESLKLSDGAMKAHLKAAGFSVPFKMTREMNNTLQSVIGEQVGLIKSIPEQYLRDVEGMVMRSVSAGRDLKALSDELQDRYGLTQKRAALIASDQANKAHAMMERARQDDLGIKKAIWMHSHGGRQPRPSHVAFDGKEYDINEGALIDGKRIWPGTEINCRCSCRAVIPGVAK